MTAEVGLQIGLYQHTYEGRKIGISKEIIASILLFILMTPVDQRTSGLLDVAGLQCPSLTIDQAGCGVWRAIGSLSLA